MTEPRTHQPGAHQPGDAHHYQIECSVCGQRGVVRLTVDPERAGTGAALAAGTHEPAVDDFGNQYLAPVRGATLARAADVLGAILDGSFMSDESRQEANAALRTLVGEAQPDGERITDARGDELEHGGPGDFPGQFLAAREKRDANP